MGACLPTQDVRPWVGWGATGSVGPKAPNSVPTLAGLGEEVEQDDRKEREEGTLGLEVPVLSEASQCPGCADAATSLEGATVLLRRRCQPQPGRSGDDTLLPVLWGPWGPWDSVPLSK